MPAAPAALDGGRQAAQLQALLRALPGLRHRGGRAGGAHPQPLDPVVFDSHRPAVQRARREAPDRRPRGGPYRYLAGAARARLLGRQLLEHERQGVRRRRQLLPARSLVHQRGRLPGGAGDLPRLRRQRRPGIQQRDQGLEGARRDPLSPFHGGPRPRFEDGRQDRPAIVRRKDRPPFRGLEARGDPGLAAARPLSALLPGEPAGVFDLLPEQHRALPARLLAPHAARSVRGQAVAGGDRAIRRRGAVRLPEHGPSVGRVHAAGARRRDPDPGYRAQPATIPQVRIDRRPVVQPADQH